MTGPAGGVLVVMPAWNEERSVGAVVRDVRAQGYDVLVVDDGSTDATSGVAAAAGATTVRLPINLGVGGAMRCGFRYAVERGYTSVVQVDADGQHPPEAIAVLLREAEATGAHLVVGSRFVGSTPGMRVGRLRRAAMSVLAWSASRAARARITDATSGFRLVNEPLLSQFARRFPSHYLGDTYEALVTAGRAGYVVREVPVVMRERTHGQSSASALAATRFTLRAVIVAGTGLHFSIDPAGSPGDKGAPAGSAR